MSSEPKDKASEEAKETAFDEIMEYRAMRKQTVFYKGFDAGAEFAEQKLERMLFDLIDTTYGLAVHHIGDGDGMSEAEADELRKFHSAYMKKRYPQKEVK